MIPSPNDAAHLFRYETLEAELRAILGVGYAPLTCAGYLDHKRAPQAARVLITRVDADLSLAKATPLLDIFERVGLRATFFVRLHAPEYNPFSFEGYRILKRMIARGHEVGLHAEPIDASRIWDEAPEACLTRDLEVLSLILGHEVRAVASHGGLTGYNNLDFFKGKDPAALGLAYEGYDETPAFNLFHESRYVSDSEWTRWKAYDKGQRLEGDARPPSAHAHDGPSVLHLLLHTDTYFHHHCYEREK
jgi:peptidoglycan/xylan/chitin deacetylase (PgdA/CDA1 family)